MGGSPVPAFLLEEQQMAKYRIIAEPAIIEFDSGRIADAVKQASFPKHPIARDILDCFGRIRDMSTPECKFCNVNLLCAAVMIEKGIGSGQGSKIQSEGESHEQEHLSPR